MRSTVGVARSGELKGSLGGKGTGHSSEDQKCAPDCMIVKESKCAAHSRTTPSAYASSYSCL